MVSLFLAWFEASTTVFPPPLDFECILNEPIWFNRFLYLHTDTKRGHLLNKDTEKRLIERGFTHLSDLLSPSTSAGAS
jgi:hypothetical protein